MDDIRISNELNDKMGEIQGRGKEKPFKIQIVTKDSRNGEDLKPIRIDVLLDINLWTWLMIWFTLIGIWFGLALLLH